MADGDAKFAAAILSRLAKQQDAMQSLFSAIESGVADLADPARTAGIERMLSAQESALADMIEAMSGPSSAIDRLTEAVKGLRMPDVNLTPTFNVPSAPAPVVKVEPNVTIEAVMPAQEAPVVHNHIAAPPRVKSFEIRKKNAYGADTVMTVTPKYED